ncbi:hypothetical protein D6853_09895 [Butyrivibrio sp. X503]|uniref:hypothetical protein n=1 Tax=Butyrivibrio sp. X503 TaxID=2364878 RepID=UPI000EA96085|nr:hypothetical protein [Butyrivibrio sp. X503]RKM55849.1 hypothetical protein D6853_09895 [Butyrivibrio sp. X503]
MNKKTLIAIDIFLWSAVILPIIKLFMICAKAYYSGAKPSFNEGPVYYGMEGFKMMFWMMMFYGFSYVIVWVLVFLVTVFFTIYMILRIKKQNRL